jgi:hypothetical protein
MKVDVGYVGHVWMLPRCQTADRGHNRNTVFKQSYNRWMIPDLLLCRFPHYLAEPLGQINGRRRIGVVRIQAGNSRE